MSEYPVKEIVLQKNYTTTVLIRANSDEEAEKRVFELAKQSRFEEEFTDEPYYNSEKYNAYKEGYIMEEVIYKD